VRQGAGLGLFSEVGMKMTTLIRREFIVGVSAEAAWGHLARVADWPSWAKHIKRIDLDPPGEITTDSSGVIHLKFGPASAFRMVEFNPPCNWKWVGRFLWLTVHYDHIFEPQGERTKLIWIVACEGFGASILGRLFALIYKRNLSKAIPRLIAEMEQSAAGC